MKIPRILLALLAFVVVFSCVSRTSPRDALADEVRYVIRNQGWHVANVFITCGDGHIIERIRQVEMGRPERGVVDVGGCLNPRFIVQLIGSDKAYASDVIQGWHSDATLFIDIASYLPLTTFRVGLTARS